jgi:hypothetical protein
MIVAVNKTNFLHAWFHGVRNCDAARVKTGGLPHRVRLGTLVLPIAGFGVGVGLKEAGCLTL